MVVELYAGRGGGWRARCEATHAVLRRAREAACSYSLLLSY